MTLAPRSIDIRSRLVHRGAHAALTLVLMVISIALSACMADLETASELAEGGEEDVATAEQQLLSDAPVNLALNKPTSQSSTVLGAASSRAVDGNTNGAWGAGSVTHTNEEAKPWWQVDLGAAQLLGSVVLYNRTDCCSDRLSNFSVFVSDDGTTNWRLAAIHPGSTPSQLRLNLIDRATNAPLRSRYVRVQLNGTNALSLAEVQVYAPALVDIAYKKPVWQSSTYNDAGAAWHAVDGNTDGEWGHSSVTHTESQYQPWLTVDLGSPQPITGVVVWNRTDCCSERLTNFRLLLSNENGNWTTYNYPGQVLKSATFKVNATARYVAVQLNGTGILSLAELQVLADPEAVRVRSVDLGGAAPGATRYAERWDESPALDVLLDPADRHLKGDFMGLGHDQILHFNRAGGGAPRVQVLDYAGGVAGGVTRYLETWGQSSLLNGWHDDGDLQLAGDFRGLGRSQVMYINRDPVGGKVMIVDYAGGAAPGAVTYIENWGYSGLLDGWLDAGDQQLVGDFMGLGHSQVMFINRGGAYGKVMIVDYAGAAPGQAKYFESWGQNPLLSGWLDGDDSQIVGDFMGLGHSQVMFINRGGADGKVMIVDYASGVAPGVVKYWEMWGQTYQLSGWIDSGDVQIAADFTGVGHDQLLLFNTKNENNGKLQVLDYGAGTWPATQKYFRSWTQGGELGDWPAPRDLLFAGKFTSSGRADLLAHRVDQSTSYVATAGNPVECPAGQAKVPSGCAPGCPAGQVLVENSQCATLVPQVGEDPPPGARIALRIHDRQRTDAYCQSSCFEPFGPAWVTTSLCAWGVLALKADTSPLASPRVFTVESYPSAEFPTAFSLRLSDGSYFGRNSGYVAIQRIEDVNNRQQLVYNHSNFGASALISLSRYAPGEHYTTLFRDFFGDTVADSYPWTPAVSPEAIDMFLLE